MKYFLPFAAVMVRITCLSAPASPRSPPRATSSMPLPDGRIGLPDTLEDNGSVSLPTGWGSPAPSARHLRGLSADGLQRQIEARILRCRRADERLPDFLRSRASSHSALTKDENNRLENFNEPLSRIVRYRLSSQHPSVRQEENLCSINPS